MSQLFHPVSLFFVGPGRDGNRLLPTLSNANPSPAYAGIASPTTAIFGAALR